MKILYDYQAFTLQVYGGVSRYFFELMKHFRQVGEPDFELSLQYSNNHYLNSGELGRYKVFLKGFEFRGKARIMSIPNKVRCKRVLSSQNFDVFHPTYYNPYFLEYIYGKPFILTIHDMIHEAFPGYFSWRDKTGDNKKILVKHAARIIAVSKSTQYDIVNYLGVAPEKIDVVYHGVPSKLTASNCLRLSLPGKYILFVGQRHTYKNFITLAKAFSIISQKIKDLSLVCVGGEPFSKKEKSLLKELNIANRTFRYSLSDEYLYFVYKNAEAFIFPSQYEGFGLPILEAFANHCPVALANASCFPEIAQEAAVYFNPNSVDELTHTLLDLLKDGEIRKKLIERADKRVKDFSWVKTADRTKAVYRSIL